ncbi:oxidoreductase [Auriculariales sp. MPI-PUGE-AT-0066]|nr:oxidoreductase [Auriculariales sp. MPI-PUGE-AT-0066]
MPVKASVASFKLNDGTHIPKTAWGCGGAQFGSDVSVLAQEALQAGIFHIDGAQAYSNEQSLGVALKSSGIPRSAVYITTKLNRIPAGSNVRTTLEESLRKLDVAYVDMFLIHSPEGHRNDHNYGGTKGTALRSVWKQMEGVREAGLTRSIGVSNFTKTDLDIILAEATVVPSLNQIRYNANLLSSSHETVELCTSKGIRIASYGGLAPIRYPGGGLTGALATLKEQAKWSKISDTQILIKWAHAKGIVAVTTTSKTQRMREIAATLTDSVPELSPDEVRQIDAAGEGRT